MGHENDNQELASPPRVTVVGIGASAGGIEALREFFDAVAPDLGLAYVVIVHLAPDHKSELAAILSRRTRMPVVEVSDDELQLKADHTYVISPDHKLEISDRTIRATPFTDAQSRRTAVDVCFRSLAEGHGDGFAVVLSGGGSDGVVGARAVKEAGGLVLVQDPEEAAHDGMPRAVVEAGVADLVLPVRELAARLGKLAREKQKFAPLVPPGSEESAVAEDDEPVLKRIFELVRARTNHDFSRYKRPTILRRLARRMQLMHCASLEPYLALLKDNPAEIQALFDDLLISVTSFFRDPLAWEALRTQVIVPLVKHAQPNHAIRAWVPGCATGEEAYTLAMLFREEIGRREVPRELVIFGSDVDQGALVTAREGLYPAAVASDVSAARLARYFRQEGEHYRVSSEIRDSVVFAAHSVMRDPPFSKLHLVSCRNLLIYLDRELQQQLQNVFRYGLRDDGYLFIGVSEAADPELFEPIDKQHRLFRARARTTGPAMRLPQLPATPLVTIERGRERAMPLRRSAAEIHLEMLEEASAPSVVLDEQWTVQHLSESAGRYLQPRGGAPSQSITELVRPELVDELRSALHRVFELQEPVLSSFVPVRFNGAARLVAVLAHPRAPEEGAGRHVLLTFLEAGEAEARQGDGSGPAQTQDGVMTTLRDKLHVAEQRLETMRQEHGMAYEDLRAANEELQSLNEEYRSTTEELETSKEELQSVNEELQTVNNELKVKLEEVSRANNDLENFMAATDIPMLFLDRELCIKRYTAPLRRLFNVKSLDHGRPISDLTRNMDYEGLERDAARVLQDLAPLERRIKVPSGESRLVRLRPYRTAEDKIDGVVVTFGDPFSGS